MAGNRRYVPRMRRVPLLLVLGALVAAAPAARADTFTVVPSAAAAPTPLKAISLAQQQQAIFERNDRARVSLKDVARFVPLYGPTCRRPTARRRSWTTAAPGAPPTSTTGPATWARPTSASPTPTRSSRAR